MGIVEEDLGFTAVQPREQRPLNMEMPFGALAQAGLPTDIDFGKSGVPLLPHQKARGRNTFDYIILGAGAVGGATALFLQQKPR